MAIYWKKPEIVEAFIWQGEELEGFERKIILPAPEGEAPTFSLKLSTPEGIKYAKKFDWLVINASGQVYPYDPAVFEATYELVPKDLGLGFQLKGDENVLSCGATERDSTDEGCEA